MVEDLDLINRKVNDQFIEFNKKTGKSMATFKRYRRILGLKRSERTFYEKKFSVKKGICFFCGNKSAITHHINKDRNDNSLINLIDLCRKCHCRLHNIMKRM